MPTINDFTGLIFWDCKKRSASSDLTPCKVSLYILCQPDEGETCPKEEIEMPRQAIKSVTTPNTDVKRVSFICVMISFPPSPEEESLKYESVGTANLFWKLGAWKDLGSKISNSLPRHIL